MTPTAKRGGEARMLDLTAEEYDLVRRALSTMRGRRLDDANLGHRPDVRAAAADDVEAVDRLIARMDRP